MKKCDFSDNEAYYVLYYKKGKDVLEFNFSKEIASDPNFNLAIEEKKDEFLIEDNKKNRKSLSDLFSSIIEKDIDELTNDSKDSSDPKCSNCGFTLKDCLEKECIGCAECYNTFKDDLDLDILEKTVNKIKNEEILTENELDDNVIKKYIKDKLKLEKEKDNEKNIHDKIRSCKNKDLRLKRKLDKCIQEENFMEAAKVRDEISNVENELAELQSKKTA